VAPTSSGSLTFVVSDIQTFWKGEFAKGGATYVPPR
jgi:hypothetical protein